MARIENGRLIFSFVTRDKYYYEDEIPLVELQKALDDRRVELQKALDDRTSKRISALEQELAEGCLDGEFVRLRDENADLKQRLVAASEHDMRERSALRAENAKLREEATTRGVARLKAKNAKLREALETIAELDSRAMVTAIARAALQKDEGG